MMVTSKMTMKSHDYVEDYNEGDGMAIFTLVLMMVTMKVTMIRNDDVGGDVEGDVEG